MQRTSSQDTFGRKAAKSSASSSVAAAAAAATLTGTTPTTMRCHMLVSFLLAITVLLIWTHPAAGAAAMISAKECGLNPMHPIQMVSQKSGRPLSHVLSVLKDIDRPSYDVLAAKFRQYAACVGIVDTGYFRRRRGGRRSNVDDELADWIPAASEMSRDYEDEIEPVSF